MNRWYQIRRLRGAAFLILVGVLALLNQWRILRWDQSWPLFLIVAGVLALAERAAWSADWREQQGIGGQPGQPSAPYAASSSWAPGPPTDRPVAGSNDPLIQPQPPTPEDSGRNGS